MISLTRKFIKMFLLKMSHKNSCVNFDAFPDKMAHLFFLKMKSLRSESVKVINNIIKYKLILQLVIVSVLLVLVTSLPQPDGPPHYGPPVHKHDPYKEVTNIYNQVHNT